MVQSQKDHKKKDSVAHELPVPAECATPEMLKRMEHLSMHAPTRPLRCWAGAHAALGHFVIRSNDFQKSKDIHLTKDAVVGVSWGMKGKAVLEPWAFPRIGLGGRGLESVDCSSPDAA